MAGLQIKAAYPVEVRILVGSVVQACNSRRRLRSSVVIQVNASGRHSRTGLRSKEHRRKPRKRARKLRQAFPQERAHLPLGARP
jgi:hypothetical protein